MKCVLVRTPQTFNVYVTAAPAVPPIGMAYVAASLREAGHDVRIVDSTGEAIDALRPADHGLLRRGLTDDQILAAIGDADLIGFSLMFSQDWLPARALIRRVRAAHPHAVLVGGGEHFSAEPVGALEDSPLDYVVTGEGDRAICQLVEHLEGKRPLDDVAGVVHRADDGAIRQTSGTDRVRDITALPWPAWDLVPLENYLAGGHGWGVDRGRNIPMVATRGCPYQCTFCSSPVMWTTRWNARDPADVVAEIEHHQKVHGATNFDFQDLTAILKRSWILEFARMLVDEGLDITWQLPTGTRSEALDEEVLELLHRSGCTNITYAPESGNEVILEKIKKKISRERMVHSMRAAVKSGCNVKANFVFGFPGDTYGQLLRSFGFLTRIAVAGVHDISVAPFRPYPGSEIFHDLQAAGELPAKLDDDYYRNLAVTAETLTLRGARSFADGISSAGLDRLRLAAMAWFFAVSFLLRPKRVAKLVYAVVTERQESRLDKSLVEMKRRVKKTWKGEEGLRVGEINPY